MSHKFGLIGRNLSHSFSKEYFNNKFKKEYLNHCKYDNYAFESIDKVGRFLQTTDCLGFNVTIPYKVSILPYLNELDECAAAVGAVNTLKIRANGEIKGFNTDVHGFSASLPDNLNPQKRALIIGSGGASKAIQFALNQQNIFSLVVSRNPSKPQQISYEDLAGLDLSTVELILNCTPLGTYPEVSSHPSFPYDKLNQDHFAYDLVYNPEETIFLKKAARMGARTQNGRKMLELQAEASWKIWQDTTI